MLASYCRRPSRYSWLSSLSRCPLLTALLGLFVLRPAMVLAISAPFTRPNSWFAYLPTSSRKFSQLYLRMIRFQARGKGNKVGQVLTRIERDGNVGIDVGVGHPLRSDGFDKNGIFPWVVRLLQDCGRDVIVDDGLHRLHSGRTVDSLVEPIPPEPDFLARWQEFPRCAGPRPRDLAHRRRRALPPGRERRLAPSPKASCDAQRFPP